MPKTWKTRIPKRRRIVLTEDAASIRTLRMRVAATSDSSGARLLSQRSVTIESVIRRMAYSISSRLAGCDLVPGSNRVAVP